MTLSQLKKELLFIKLRTEEVERQIEASVRLLKLKYQELETKRRHKLIR